MDMDGTPHTLPPVRRPCHSARGGQGDEGADVQPHRSRRTVLQSFGGMRACTVTMTLPRRVGVARAANLLLAKETSTFGLEFLPPARRP